MGNTIVIIGATSSIAAHCARLWCADAPSEMILVGRSLDRVERVAADLRVRAPATAVSCIDGDFSDPAWIQALADRTCADRKVDIVLVAHGSLPSQDACQRDLGACHEALSVNGLSPVLFAEAFANHLQRTGSGTIAIIGSVAGDRGRKSNYVYGAAKGLVARYAQGLQHRLAGTQVQVVLVKPGPTDTPMTAHLKQQGQRLASPADVAARIVRAVKRGQHTVYAPAKWGAIMMVIRHLPRIVFNRMDI